MTASAVPASKVLNAFIKETITPVLLAHALFIGPAHASERASGGSEAQKMVVRGQTTSGCPEKPMRKRTALPGDWLALTETAVQPTRLWVDRARIVSERPSERYFFRDIPLGVGPITTARVKGLDVGSTARTEHDVALGNARYRFIEWGAFEFALVTLSSSGKATGAEFSHSEIKAIPPEAYSVTKEPRDIYEPGTLKILMAGDFNADGVPDLLLDYWSKEAGGLVLWLSDPRTGRHHAPFVAATRYSDCG